jgi:hypothetical protein
MGKDILFLVTSREALIWLYWRRSVEKWGLDWALIVLLLVKSNMNIV